MVSNQLLRAVARKLLDKLWPVAIAYAADNNITALRVLQAGIEAVKATGALTMDTQPTATDTITVAGVLYTWVASGATAGQINRGANIGAAQTNLVAAINGTDSIQAGPNPHVSAAAFIGNVMTVTARLPGTSTHSLATTETFTAGTNVWAATTLGGGSIARGTLVAATQRLAVEQLEWGDDDEVVAHAEVQNGILTRYSGPGTAVRHGTRFTLPDQNAIWEQLPLWFAMLLGAPVITQSALGGPVTLTWTSAPSSYPNPFSATFQRRFDNGATQNDERAGYAMLSQLGLSYSDDGTIQLGSGEGFARKFATNAITSGLSLPSFEMLVSALSSVYIDPLWADVGTTLISEQVIGWDWLHNSGLFPRFTADLRSALDFNKHQINGGERLVAVNLQCLMDPTTYAAEQTRAGSSATNQFAVRVKATGSNSRELRLDAMMQHDKPLWSPGTDQGQDIVNYTLVEAPDSSNFLRVVMILPTIPTW